MTRNEIGELLEKQGLLHLPGVEVGVASGRYSEVILSWGLSPLYLVDLWRHVPGSTGCLGQWDDATHNEKMVACLERLADYVDKYIVLRGWSHEAVDQIEDESLGFVYIDATHDYEAVLRDLHAYLPKLVRGGMLAGHDWPLAGIRQAVEEFAAEKDFTINLLPTNENDISFWMSNDW